MREVEFKQKQQQQQQQLLIKGNKTGKHEFTEIKYWF